MKLNGAIRLIAINERLMNSRVLKFLTSLSDHREGEGYFCSYYLSKLKEATIVSNPLLEWKRFN